MTPVTGRALASRELKAARTREWWTAGSKLVPRHQRQSEAFREVAAGRRQEPGQEPGASKSRTRGARQLRALKQAVGRHSRAWVTVSLDVGSNGVDQS